MVLSAARIRAYMVENFHRATTSRDLGG
jgi:hypothetical protein